jgi:hypothetical protein
MHSRLCVTEWNAGKLALYNTDKEVGSSSLLFYDYEPDHVGHLDNIVNNVYVIKHEQLIRGGLNFCAMMQVKKLSALKQ